MPERSSLGAAIELAANAERITCSQNTLICINRGTSSRAEDPWTDHGDVGWISAEGEVFIVGRTSDIAPADFAAASARQISPVYEVEHLLRLEWDAADAAAVLIDADGGAEKPEIWVGTVDCKDQRADARNHPAAAGH